MTEILRAAPEYEPNPKDEPKTIAELLADRVEYCGDEQDYLLEFDIPEGYIAYNPSVPFKNGDEWMMLVRVERVEDEAESEVWAFHCDPDTKMQRYGGEAPSEDDEIWRKIGQDPSVAIIGDELIVGAIEVRPDENNPTMLVYRQAFWRGASLDSLEPFVAGPDGMKDIRVVDMGDGQVGVYTRPQEDILEGAGPGKIGFRMLNSIDQLAQIDLVADVPIVDGLFADGEWGGVNHVEHLGDGINRVWGHVARWVDVEPGVVEGDRIREYYGVVFIHDTNTGDISDMQIVAGYDDFDQSQITPKRDDLRRIVFPAGCGIFALGDSSVVIREGVPVPGRG